MQNNRVRDRERGKEREREKERKEVYCSHLVVISTTPLSSPSPRVERHRLLVLCSSNELRKEKKESSEQKLGENKIMPKIMTSLSFRELERVDSESGLCDKKRFLSHTGLIERNNYG